VTPQAGLLLSSIAFVGLHFLFSHPLRAVSVRKLGERGFQAFYSVQSLLTFGLMIYFYRAIGREPPVFTVDSWVWAARSSAIRHSPARDWSGGRRPPASSRLPGTR
jgi:uncharacterized membrane protein